MIIFLSFYYNLNLEINKFGSRQRLLYHLTNRQSPLVKSIKYPFFVYPEKKLVNPRSLSIFLKDKNNIYVGDIHSNELTLWQILKASRLIVIPNERELFRELHKLRSFVNPKNPFEFTNKQAARESYKKIVKMIDEMTWTNLDRKLFLLGDEICDRGGVLDPLVMLTVLKFQNNIIPHLSNHGIAAFIRVYYPGLVEQFKRATPHKADNTVASMLRTQSLFEPKDYLPIYERYFQLWKVLSFDKDNALIFSHAPLDKPILGELRGLTGLICELPDTLDCWRHFVDQANSLWTNYAKVPNISAFKIIGFFTNLSSTNGFSSRNHLCGEPLSPLKGLTNVHGHTNRQVKNLLRVNGYITLDQRVGTRQRCKQHDSHELMMYLYVN